MNSDMESDRGFAIERSALGSAVILAPAGSLTSETCSALSDALETAATGPQPTIVIDGRQVGAMDSEALEALIDWHHRLRDADGGLKLANLNDVCVDILMVTRLVHVLDVCEDISQATQGG